jgi:sulfite exporter TauE/SafE/copper chaperone CopZ
MSQKMKIDITGMHCRSCEILLEDSISQVQGVKKVRTNFKKGSAEIEYDQTPDQKEIEKAVNTAGYRLGKEDKKHFFSRNPMDYLELAAVAVVVGVVYAILKTLGILNLDLSASSPSGLVGVLIIGITAGFSTCMALIGGLVLGISARHAELHPEATVAQKFRPHLFFNLGRLLSYVLLGGVIGLIGSGLTLSSPVLGTLTIILGGVMLFLGLKLIDIFPKLQNKSIVLPKSISRLLGVSSEVKEYSHRSAFVTGALTFFMPCGFTQAMQLYAISTGSFVQGALIMGAFALGTLPGIISIGGLTSTVKGAFARYFFKFAGVVVIALAFFNIGSGFNLTGFSFASVVQFNGQEQTAGGEVRIEDGKQIVEMTQHVSGYSPNTFTIKKGIPVVWNIKSTSQFTCAAFISMPTYDIRQPLQTGENTIEFTPTQTGTLRFTCSMGMYSGTFTVVD